MKTYLQTGFLSALVFCALSANAQTPFWAFDSNNNEIDIPVQCDGQFDETRGGVVMPTAQELFEQGDTFLQEKGDTKNGAAYCFLAAALQGNVDAQYRVAQLYNKGLILPQNELAAYKWAFIASLSGHHDAEQLALTLEQYLSTDDIALATESVSELLPQLTVKKQFSLQIAESELQAKKDELESINKEIDGMLGIHFEPPVIEKPSSDEDQSDQKDKK